MEPRTLFLIDMVGACVFTLAAMLSIVFGRIEGPAVWAVLCMVTLAAAFAFSMIAGLLDVGNGLVISFVALALLVALACAFVAIVGVAI